MLNCIDDSATLGKDCQIGNFTTIGPNCVLGDRVVVHNNVTLYPGTEIGDDTEIFDGAVIGRPPKSNGNLKHRLAENFKATTIGVGCIIGANAVIYIQNKIGDHVLIGDGAKIREGCFLDDYTLVAMNCTLNHDVTIKKYSKVIDLSHITANTIIEQEVFIGTLVGSANDNGMHIRGNEVGSSRHIHIKAGSRIGSHSMLLPGVTIGEDSLVAASALVTHDVPDHTRVMGIPAKEK